MRTPAENEQLVREHWPAVKVECDFGWHFWFGGMALGGPYLFVEEQSDGVPWGAAATFTEKRMEEIRQVEAEIDAVIYWLDNAVYKATPKRILAREKVALAELKLGMK